MPPGASTTIRVVALFLLVGAVIAGLWVTWIGGDTPAVCQAPGPDLDDARAHNPPANESAANVSVERVSATAIQLTYNDLDGIPGDYGVSLPPWLREMGVRVNAASGFAIYRSANGTDLVLKESASSPQVTVVTEPTAAGSGVDSAGAAITDDWAFVPLPPHTAPTNVSLAAGQPGVVGDQVLLLGTHRTATRQVGCQDVVVHVPTALESHADPERIADSLAAASRDLDVGWRYERVRAFGVGDPIGPGGRTFTHEIWVRAGTEVGLPEREARFPPRPVAADTWLHQIQHTRQRWVWNGTVSRNASWLSEALASYYDVQQSVHQGRLSACNATVHWNRLNASLHRGPGTMNLTAPRTYQHRAGAYTRGSFVLAALDQRIRSRTAGTRSLAHVWRRLNERRNVTARSFRDAVVATAGPGIDPWLDRYVAGTAVPSPPATPLECVGGSGELGPVKFGLLAAFAGLVAVLLGRLLAEVVLNR